MTLVERAEEYRWSSARRYLRRQTVGVPITWIEWTGSPGDSPTASRCLLPGPGCSQPGPPCGSRTVGHPQA